MLLAKMLLAMLLVLAYLSPAAAEVLRRDYEGFTVWLDCERRGAVKFRYNAQDDLERPSTFRMDPDAPERCQQTSTHAYSHPDPKYHRGHLVPANHLDHSETAMRQSNFMTNILPQTQTLNLGAWKRTEAITECYRDIDELLVIGGVIWGDNAADDYFTQSHGVATPDAYWKLILRGTDRVIAWVFPTPRKREARSSTTTWSRWRNWSSRQASRFRKCQHFAAPKSPTCLGSGRLAAIRADAAHKAQQMRLVWLWRQQAAHALWRETRRSLERASRVRHSCAKAA
jgi:hypothetical protein